MSVVARVTQSFEVLEVLKPKLQATLAIGDATSPVFTHGNTAMSTFLLHFYTDNFAPTTYGCSNVTKHSISQSQSELCKMLRRLNALLSIFHQLLVLGVAMTVQTQPFI